MRNLILKSINQIKNCGKQITEKDRKQNIVSIFNEIWRGKSSGIKKINIKEILTSEMLVTRKITEIEFLAMDNNCLQKTMISIVNEKSRRESLI